MTQLALRPATPRDLAVITRLAEAFNLEDGHPLTPEGKKALEILCQGTPHGHAFMIEQRQHCIGYIVIGLGFSIEFGGIDAFLDEFYIEPPHRGAGLGAQALEALTAFAQEMQIRAIHLEAMPENDKAARLYLRMGYHLSQRRLMSKPIRHK